VTASPAALQESPALLKPSTPAGGVATRAASAGRARSQADTPRKPAAGNARATKAPELPAAPSDAERESVAAEQPLVAPSSPDPTPRPSVDAPPELKLEVSDF
jgi:hypothetical protein